MSLTLCFAHANIASNLRTSGISKFRHIIICTMLSLKLRKSGVWNKAYALVSTKAKIILTSSDADV